MHPWCAYLVHLPFFAEIKPSQEDYIKFAQTGFVEISNIQGKNRAHSFLCQLRVQHQVDQLLLWKQSWLRKSWICLKISKRNQRIL